MKKLLIVSVLTVGSAFADDPFAGAQADAYDAGNYIGQQVVDNIDSFMEQVITIGAFIVSSCFLTCDPNN